jgi:serine/threonine-protein kinase
MKTFGKYELLEEIGSGAAGTTYRARDTFRDIELALKVLRPVLPTSKKQLCRELAACAELQHPRIARIHDLGEADGAIYIAAELLAGTDLRKCFQIGAEWPLVQKLKFMAQVCDGLAFAHRKKIAHGNIKPSNIFITGNREPRILDFGIARWPASFPTADAGPAQSPNYLSPEQILEQPFDERSDLFSVAILLYEFIVGLYPFQVPDGLIPREIVHGEPQPLRKLDPQIPERLERLLLLALEKDPQRRLQSADEFAVSLYAIARQLQAEQTIPVPELSSAPVAAERKEVLPGTADEFAFSLYAMARHLQAEQTIPVSRVSSAPATTERAEVLAGAQETHQPHLAAAPPARLAVFAVTAGATGGTNSNLSVTTTLTPSGNPDLASSPPAAPQSVLGENAPSPEVAVVAPSSVTAQAAMLPAQVVPYANLSNSPNGVEIEPQVASPLPSPKRFLLVAGAAAIGILILAALLTYHRTNASPAKVQGQTNQSGSALPRATQSEPAHPPALAVDTPPAPVETSGPQPEQTLRGPVASLWEAGNYVQAMKLVDAILADDPSNAEARAWKVKIRAAQEAEDSIK